MLFAVLGVKPDVSVGVASNYCAGPALLSEHKLPKSACIEFTAILFALVTGTITVLGKRPSVALFPPTVNLPRPCLS